MTRTPGSKAKLRLVLHLATVMAMTFGIAGTALAADPDAPPAGSSKPGSSDKTLPPQKLKPAPTPKPVRGPLPGQSQSLLAAFEKDTGFAARFYHALAIFLSDRLRSATAEGAADDELDEGLLDTLHQAGDRFVRLLNLLGGRER